MAARVALTASIAFLIVVVTPWGEAPPVIALAFLAGVTPLPIITAVVFAPLKTIARRARFKQAISAGADQASNASGQPATVARKRTRYGLGMTSEVESALSNRRPLTVLDHIDLFEDARLDSEGITDTEALAHGEIVDLLVATRTPAGRLVDWVDQALLVIHIDQPSTGGGADGHLGNLRGLGVRTATELVNASSKATVDPRTGTPRHHDELKAVFGSESTLVAVVDSITAEPNYRFVSWWKTSPLGQPTGDEKLVLGADGCLQARPPMDQGGRCGSVISNTNPPPGNGHRDEDADREPIPVTSSTAKVPVT